MEDSKPGRRDFFKTAGAIFTTSLFTGRLRGANDRPTAGFIGVGVMGTENLGVALKHGVEVRAVCDVYQPHLERAGAIVAESGQETKKCRDFREILADKSIDLVCISTPDHWHPYMTVEACKAGKDVYVEKPACLAIDDGLKMVEAARKYNRVVQAGTWQRSGEHFQKACEMVRSGEIWKVAFARTWIYSNEPQEGSAIRRTVLHPRVWTGRCGWDHRPNVHSIRTGSACTQKPIRIFGGSGTTLEDTSLTPACTCWIFCKWRSMRRCQKRLPPLAENSGSKMIARRPIRCR